MDHLVLKTNLWCYSRLQITITYILIGGEQHWYSSPKLYSHCKKSNSSSCDLHWHWLRSSVNSKSCSHRHRVQLILIAIGGKHRLTSSIYCFKPGINIEYYQEVKVLTLTYDYYIKTYLFRNILKVVWATSPSNSSDHSISH